jgi:hypothetical protein
MFVGYHVATAYYVESWLAFRDVKLHVALYVWISAVALTASLWPAALIAAAEPTYKFTANIKARAPPPEPPEAGPPHTPRRLA